MSLRSHYTSTLPLSLFARSFSTLPEFRKSNVVAVCSICSLSGLVALRPSANSLLPAGAREKFTKGTHEIVSRSALRNCGRVPNSGSEERNSYLRQQYEWQFRARSNSKTLCRHYFGDEISKCERACFCFGLIVLSSYRLSVFFNKP